jgi:hypothetical protein
MWKSLLLCVAAVPGFAAQILFGPQPFALSIVDSTGTLLSPDTTSADLQFPQFDPALGTLTGVTYQLRSSERSYTLSSNRAPPRRAGPVRLTGAFAAPGIVTPFGVAAATFEVEPDTFALYTGTGTLYTLLTLSAGRPGRRWDGLTFDAQWQGDLTLLYRYEPEVPAPEPASATMALLGLAAAAGCVAFRDSARRGSGNDARRGRR